MSNLKYWPLMPWKYNVLTYVCALETNADAHNAMVKKSYMLIRSSKSIFIYKKAPPKKPMLNSQQHSYLNKLRVLSQCTFSEHAGEGMLAGQLCEQTNKKK